jgi:hypothetical protein
MLMLLAVVTVAAPLQAAFLVEADSDGAVVGLANDHFTGTPRWSIPSGAYGVTTDQSAYGNTVVADPDVYQYRYTPGTDADNLTIPAGTDLGNGDLATGLTGGGNGLYNVYTTWPDSANVASLATIAITHDGGEEILTNVNMNTGQSGDPGGNNAWLLIAEGIELTAGNTYTVTQSAPDAWTSMRSHGVLWEAVPEPVSLSLLGIGALFIHRRRRNR